ncbi:hypothetical protein SSAG_00298 [Streptomyces sp. Mg1]|nr:hypothetical protein SSAG_00298 [Streptomyces sp. Mg1]
MAEEVVSGACGSPVRRVRGNRLRSCSVTAPALSTGAPGRFRTLPRVAGPVAPRLRLASQKGTGPVVPRVREEEPEPLVRAGPTKHHRSAVGSKRTE